jgi:hypothetical protein
MTEKEIQELDELHQWFEVWTMIGELRKLCERPPDETPKEDK